MYRPFGVEFNYSSFPISATYWSPRRRTAGVSDVSIPCIFSQFAMDAFSFTHGTTSSDLPVCHAGNLVKGLDLALGANKTLNQCLRV